jgi:BMFP domain-containing protein YqiC
MVSMSEISDNLGTDFHKQHLIQLRRAKVPELASQGLTQDQISLKLGCSQSLISLDLQALKCQAAASVSEYVTQTIPFEFQKALSGISVVIRDSFKISNSADTDAREKLEALTLVLTAYEKRLEILTNSTMIDKVAQSISSMKKQIENIQHQADNNDNQSSIDYGQQQQQELEEDSQAKFGYSCDGTVNGPLGHYDASVGHIVYEPWEIELHENLEKWNREYKEKKEKEGKPANEYEKDGNRQF